MQSQQFKQFQEQLQQFPNLLQKHDLPAVAREELSSWYTTLFGLMPPQPTVAQTIPTTTTTTTVNNTQSTVKPQQSKPHQVRSKQGSIPKKQQYSPIHEAIEEQLLATIQTVTSNSNIELPVASAIEDATVVNESSLIPQTVAINTLNWDNILIKKSKETADVCVFTFPTLLKVANHYIKSLNLRPTPSQNKMSDDTTPTDEIPTTPVRPLLTPQRLATTWSVALQDIISSYLQKDYQYHSTMDNTTTIDNAPDDATINWIMKSNIKLKQPENNSRCGALDFQYFPQLAQTNNTEQGTKRKAHPPVTPTLSASQSDVMIDTVNGEANPKQKTNNIITSPDAIENQIVSLTDSSTQQTTTTTTTTTTPITNQRDEFTTLSGLFDFTPTTGECRHCTNPETKGLQEYSFTAMGYLDSVFRSKFSTPRQGNASETTYGSLTIANDVRADAVQGLEQYNYVWLVFIFHSNKMHNYKPKITPPRLGERVGWLSTRTPHRWNDIGLSLVKLEKVEYPQDYQHLPKDHPLRNFTVHSPGINSKAKNLPGCARLIFSGVDLIDGTPILDVKPFTPGDIPSVIPRYPQWLAEAKPYTLDIQFHKQTLIDLYTIFLTHYQQQFAQLYQKEIEKQQQEQQQQNQIEIIADDNLKPSNIHASADFSIIQQKLDEFEKLCKDLLIPQSSSTTTSTIIANNSDDNDTTSTTQQQQQRTDADDDKLIETILSAESTILQQFLTSALSSPLEFYTDIQHIKRGLVETLRNDPRPVQTKKSEHRARSIFGFLFDNLNVVYQMTNDNQATICFVQHRNEYLMLQKQGNNNITTGLMNGNNNNNNNITIPAGEYKKRWMQLIKDKLSRTTTNVTDNWFFEIGIEQQQKE